jgi:hypothetical protein
MGKVMMVQVGSLGFTTAGDALREHGGRAASRGEAPAAPTCSTVSFTLGLMSRRRDATTSALGRPTVDWRAGSWRLRLVVSTLSPAGAKQVRASGVKHTQHAPEH